MSWLSSTARSQKETEMITSWNPLQPYWGPVHTTLEKFENTKFENNLKFENTALLTKMLFKPENLKTPLEYFKALVKDFNGKNNLSVIFVKT